MTNDNNKLGLWTYKQTATFLGSTIENPISERSVMRLCKAGKIRRIYPIPKKPRIDPLSVYEYVASLTSTHYDKHAQDGGYKTAQQKHTPRPKKWYFLNNINMKRKSFNPLSV